MGNSPPPKQFNAKSEKQKFEITCIKVRSYLELQRDRRQNQANGKEKSLIQMFNSPTRSKQDEVQKASSIITDLSYIKAANIVIRFCDILKENSLRVIEAKGHSEKITNLLPYIESVCWSSKPLNLSCINEFQSQMIYFFGANINESIIKSEKIDMDLKECFKELLPTPIQINDYIVAFSNRIGIPLSQINAAGHEFAQRGGAYGAGGPSGGNYNEFNENYQPPIQFSDPNPQNYQQFPQQFPQNPQQFPQIPQQFPQNPQNYQQFPQNPQNYQQIPQNPSFGAFHENAAPQEYLGPPVNNQFGGFQAINPTFQPSAGFGETGNFNTNNQQIPQNLPKNPPENFQQITQKNDKNYPEFGGITVPKNNAALQQGAEGKGGNQLPNLDDFEERMRKLRENL